MQRGRLVMLQLLRRLYKYWRMQGLHINIRSAKETHKMLNNNNKSRLHQCLLRSMRVSSYNEDTNPALVVMILPISSQCWLYPSSSTAHSVPIHSAMVTAWC